MRLGGLLPATVLVLAAAAPLAPAADHDFCVNPAMDAGGSFVQSGLLVSTDCVGEMRVGGDHHDWYHKNLAATQSTATVSATLCPTTTKTGPWNPNLAVSFVPADSIVPSLPFVPIPQVNAALQSTTGTVTPGVLVGSSNNAAGCDAVAATVGNANAGRVYVHVTRASGDGFYDLQVVVS